MSITTSGGLTVTNILSKAGFATRFKYIYLSLPVLTDRSIHVKGIGKQCDILFDCGILDEEMLSAKHIFISHGHIDHVGACVSHARGERICVKLCTSIEITVLSAQLERICSKLLCSCSLCRSPSWCEAFF